ncbi:MAG TPA: DNA methyltransferase [Fimbriimonas sp.]|nr:DNA methyltransferase [Fimbriimonas sp.]
MSRTGSLPLKDMPAIWHEAPRRWGHPLHSVCSYLAMFPPQMASVFIRWLTDEGDGVYDPFSGRGTVALEALLQGRTGFGSDANPLAHALTKAKVKVPSISALERRLNELEQQFRRAPDVCLAQVPDDISMLYSADTLRQIVFLRNELSPLGFVDPFITALVLGMLHANHSQGGATRGFSISMPNTFAMAPGYVRRYIKEHGLVAPNVDVFQMLRVRAQRYELPSMTTKAGRSWLGDAEKAVPAEVAQAKPKLIFTSPPYLQVIKYGKYNWVRLWFLNYQGNEVDQGLMASSSLSRYLAFMKKVLDQMKTAVDPEGYICLVIGDVRRDKKQLNLADVVWTHAAEPAGWHQHATLVDDLPEGRKVSRIWKENSGRATKTDRLLLMSPHSGVSLPDLPEIDWSITPDFSSLAMEE